MNTSLNKNQKAQILELFNMKISIEDIARCLDKPYGTIRNFIEKYKLPIPNDLRDVNIVKTSLRLSRTDKEKCLAVGWKEVRFQGQKALTNGKVIFVNTQIKSNKPIQTF